MTDLANQATKFMPNGKILGRDNISNYVNQKHLPTPLVLKAIAGALGVDQADLLPTRGDPSKDDVAPPDVRDLGDGQAFLRINKRLPWAKAIEILRLVAPDPR